jgi:hypothetical protein
MNGSSQRVTCSNKNKRSVNHPSSIDELVSDLPLEVQDGLVSIA